MNIFLALLRFQTTVDPKVCLVIAPVQPQDFNRHADVTVTSAANLHITTCLNCETNVLHVKTRKINKIRHLGCVSNQNQSQRQHLYRFIEFYVKCTKLLMKFLAPM